MFFPSQAVHPVGVVANVNESVSALARVEKSVGAGPQQGLALVATGRLVVQVAVFLVGLGPGLAPAVLVTELVRVGSGARTGRTGVTGVVALVDAAVGVVGIVVQEGALWLQLI